MAEHKTSPILELFKQEHGLFLEFIRTKLEIIVGAIEDDPGKLILLDGLDRKDPAIDEFIRVMEKVAAKDPAAYDELATWHKANFHDDDATREFMATWVNNEVVPNAELGSKIAAAREKGAKTTSEKAGKRKRKFQALYLEEEAKEAGKPHAKEGSVKVAIDRFRANGGKISERTAWEYIKDLK